MTRKEKGLEDIILDTTPGLVALGEGDNQHGALGFYREAGAQKTAAFRFTLLVCWERIWILFSTHPRFKAQALLTKTKLTRDLKKWFNPWICVLGLLSSGYGGDRIGPRAYDLITTQEFSRKLTEMHM